MESRSTKASSNAAEVIKHAEYRSQFVEAYSCLEMSKRSAVAE